MMALKESPGVKKYPDSPLWSKNIHSKFEWPLVTIFCWLPQSLIVTDKIVTGGEIQMLQTTRTNITIFSGRNWLKFRYLVY